MAIQREEEIKKKKYEDYNKKLNDFNKNRKLKEEKDKEEKMKMQTMKETKESEFFKRKNDIEQKEEEFKKNYMLKQEEKEERMKVAKEDKQKENLSKSNKLYISAMNNRVRHIREENALEYRRTMKIENMEKRLQLLQEKNQKKKDAYEERRRLENEVNKDKQIMLDRLQNIMQSDKDLSKEDINNFVFKGIKPENKKKDDNDNEINEGKKNGDKAFITS